MAEKTLPTQDMTRALNATYFTDGALTPQAQRLVNGTLTTGDQFLVQNDEKTFLHVKNGATAANIVIDRDITVDTTALSDRTEAVPANGERFIRDFPRHIYGDTLRFAIDDVSNVTVAVLRVP